MKILLTGGDGFLGSAVLRKLRENYSDVVSVTRRAGIAEGYASCDLSEPAAVTRLLVETRPECIVNLAVQANFGQSVLHSLYPVNSLCPAIFADYCHKHDAYLVQASGTIVQGFQHLYSTKYTSEIPNTDYGISKLLAERAIAAAGCTAGVLRFGGIFGAYGPEHLGINKAITQSKKGITPKVVASGAAKRNYIYVEDAAMMIERCIADQLKGVFMAGGETISIREMLQSICDQWLPGQTPITIAGEESQDQLIEVSAELGPFRSFRECVQDCH